MRRFKTWLEAFKNFIKTNEIKNILQNNTMIYATVKTALSHTSFYC